MILFVSTLCFSGPLGWQHHPHVSAAGWPFADVCWGPMPVALLGWGSMPTALSWWASEPPTMPGNPVLWNLGGGSHAFALCRGPNSDILGGGQWGWGASWPPELDRRSHPLKALCLPQGPSTLGLDGSGSPDDFWIPSVSFFHCLGSTPGFYGAGWYRPIS